MSFFIHRQIGLTSKYISNNCTELRALPLFERQRWKILCGAVIEINQLKIWRIDGRHFFRWYVWQHRAKLHSNWWEMLFLDPTFGWAELARWFAITPSGEWTFPSSATKNYVQLLTQNKRELKQNYLLWRPNVTQNELTAVLGMQNREYMGHLSRPFLWIKCCKQNTHLYSAADSFSKSVSALCWKDALSQS